MARNKVVFPAPLSPRTTCNFPSSNSASTPRNAAKRPNCLIKLLTVMMLAASVTGVGMSSKLHSGDEFTGERDRVHRKEQFLQKGANAHAVPARSNSRRQRAERPAALE